MAPPRTAAVVGSGCAGLAAADALASRGVRVTLFEAADRLGGHADTRQVEGVDVDVGFMVFNRVTYPNMARALSAKPEP
jgi:cyclopropane-fatty-acyl-phospholipid synthase